MIYIYLDTIGLDILHINMKPPSFWDNILADINVIKSSRQAGTALCPAYVNIYYSQPVGLNINELGQMNEIRRWSSGF